MDNRHTISIITVDSPPAIRLEMRATPESEPVATATMGIGYARDLASRLHHAIAHLESIGKEAGK